MTKPVANLYVADNNKQSNQDLIQFLKSNLSKITVHMFIHAAVADNTKQQELYNNTKIYGVPALVVNNTTIIGYKKIKDFIENTMLNKPIEQSSDDELLREHMENILDVEKFKSNTASKSNNGGNISNARTSPIQFNDEDDDDETQNIQKKMDAAVRQQINARPGFGAGDMERENNLSSTQTVDNAQLNKNNDIDTQLLLNHLDNQL